MKSSIKLSESGVKRLKAFKADIEGGEFKFEVGHESNGVVMYYEVTSGNGFSCVFVSKEELIEGKLIADIDNTLNNPVGKIYHSNKSLGFFFSVLDMTVKGVNLSREDITFPAQRALEALK